jgi:predicted TIM-barrel fold metal-dependent hydrolase
MAESLRLADYTPRSELVTPRHVPARPRFPAIDFHGHFASLYSDLYAAEGLPRRGVEETVEELRASGIRRIVNLDGFWDGFFDMTVDTVMAALHEHRDFFVTFVSVDTGRVDEPGFAEGVRRHLRAARDKGARGIKLFKHLTIMVPDGSGRWKPGRGTRIDDPRFSVIWDTAAELGLPVLVHIGDPRAFFRPVDGRNERYEELQHHPEWRQDGPGLWTFDELMEMQENLLAANPRTTFVVAHAGSCAEDLARVDAQLERFPHLYVDIAERINELGRQPYTARRFFLRWQDRILFGTDAYPGQMAARYPPYFRFLETWDEYFDWSGYETRWKIYGIGLDDPALEKIYCRNAEKLLGP